MKGKKLLSGLTALAIAATSFAAMTLNVGAADGEDGVYIGSTLLPRGQYMDSSQTVLEGAEHVVGEGDCTAYLSEDGVLTLGGRMEVSEVRQGDIDIWGAISPKKDHQAVVIELLPEANITLNSSYYSGIYGNYAPITISGSGNLLINTSKAEAPVENYGASNGGLVVYDKTAANNITITDGANVTIKGTEGVALQNEAANGNIYVTDGGTLTVDVTGTSFSKAPVIQSGSTVWIKDDSGTEKEWTGSDASELTSKKYVKIESRKYPKSIGIQELNADKSTWLYNGHYYPIQNVEEGASIHYDGNTGVLDFYEDIELRDVTYSGYYGSGIAPDPIVAGKELTIRLNNNANVTIDATKDRGTDYLYGLYTTGKLTIEGSGTLKIMSSGGTYDNAALCVFSGAWLENQADLTVKGDVNLILENKNTSGYALNVYGAYVGNINIQDNAAVEMIGGAKALNKADTSNLNIAENLKIYAGDSKDSAAEIQASKIADQKYILISLSEPEQEPETITASEAKLAFKNGEVEGITVNENGEATADGETISAWSLTAADGISFANGGTVTATLNDEQESSASVNGVSATVESAATVYVLVNRPFADVQSVIFTPNAQ